MNMICLIKLTRAGCSARTERKNVMAGYYKNSMSNNAIEAYKHGEKPFSKWTKKEILEELGKRRNLDLNDSKYLPMSQEIFSELSKCSEVVVKQVALEYTSYHHTGKLYRKTNFYSIDYDGLRNLDSMDIAIAKQQIETKRYYKDLEKDEVEEKERALWKVQYPEYSKKGTRRICKEIIDTGYIEGIWFVSDTTGCKKRITANSFVKIKKISEKERLKKSKKK